MTVNFKTTITFLLIGLALVGCKKEDETNSSNSNTNQSANSGEIVCDLDGNYQVYSIAGSNTNHYDDNYASSPTGKLIQAGRTNADVDVFVIDIWKDLDQIVTPATYEVTPIDFANYEDDVVSYGNAKECMITYFEFSTNVFYRSWHERGNTTLTINSKTNDLIEGTFSGWLYADIIDFTNPFVVETDSIHVTNGEFKIQLVRGSIIEAANQ